MKLGNISATYGWEAVFISRYQLKDTHTWYVGQVKQAGGSASEVALNQDAAAINSTQAVLLLNLVSQYLNQYSRLYF